MIHDMTMMKMMISQIVSDLIVVKEDAITETTEDIEKEVMIGNIEELLILRLFILNLNDWLG